MMRRFLLSLGCAVALVSPAADAPLSPAVTPDCQYLFLVDTSAEMGRSAEGLLETLDRLITSGLEGRMRAGEIFTVWTYSDEPQLRQFPLNAWTPELNLALARRVNQFVQAQKFRGRSNLPAACVEVRRAMIVAPNLTVIVLSSGEDVVVGTPFDRAINVTYGRRAVELRDLRMPFITALTAKDGKFIEWEVRGGNEELVLPGLPPPLEPAASRATAQLTAPASKPAAPAPAPAAVPPKPPTTPPTVGKAQDIFSLPGVDPVPPAKSKSAPTAVSATPAVEPKSLIATAPIAPQPPPARPAIPAKAPPAEPTSAPVIAASPPPPAPKASATFQPLPPPTPAPVVELAQPAPPPAAPAAPVPIIAEVKPAPPPTAAPAPALVVAAVAPAVTPASVTPLPGPPMVSGPRAESPLPPPVPSAVAVPGRAQSGVIYLLVAGLMLAVAGGLIAFWTRRPPSASIITKSFEEKP